MLDKILYEYIETAIIHNLDYDKDKFVILACDNIYFELDNNIFVGKFYLVDHKEFLNLAKKLLKQNKEIKINKENTKELVRQELHFYISKHRIMDTLYNMTGL